MRKTQEDIEVPADDFDKNVVVVRTTLREEP